MIDQTHKYALHFAPLQGHTEAGYRNAHSKVFGGIDAYYTPFVRLEQGGMRNKDLRDLVATRNNVPRLIPQLIANKAEDAEIVLKRFIGEGYTEVDFNMGCPFPLLTRRGKGAGILTSPQQVDEVLKLTNAYPTINFSVKMRLGLEDPEECLRLLPILAEAQLQHITLHARTGKQQYKGICNLEAFEAFYKECPHPLLYNGDIQTAEEVERLYTRFPRLAGVMLGRGLLANPALAMEIQTQKTLSKEELYSKVFTLHQNVWIENEKLIEGGEAQLLGKMKTFWEYLLPDAEKKLRKKILKSNRTSDYLLAVKQLLLI